jgi:hypothetical protein
MWVGQPVTASPRIRMVESAWDAVSGLLLVRFPRLLAEPAVRVSTQRALMVSAVGWFIQQRPTYPSEPAVLAPWLAATRSPRRNQRLRVVHEVEQVVEPAARIAQR